MQLNGEYKNCYLVYSRKSTDDADNQKNSISYQTTEGIKLAKFKGFEIANVDIPNFCTAGVIKERHTAFKEGTSFTIGPKGVQYAIERPKFHTLAQYLWKGQFKGVIFLCWDRASRNKSDNNILHKLIEKGVDVVFVQTTYDRTSSGQLHMDIDGMFSQHYSRVIREKIINTNKKLRNDGICIYRAPIGYLNTGDSANKPFDPKRAPLIKQLFEKYATESWSLADLARWGNEQGITMPAVRRKRTLDEELSDEEVIITPVERMLTATNVHNILTNPFYIGKIVGNDGVYVASNSHKALVDDELFSRVQKVLKRKKVSTHYVQKLYFPYRGLIRCANCNRVYTPYEQKGIHYYGVRCIPHCSNLKKSINEKYIDKIIGNALKELIFSEEEIEEINQNMKTDISMFEAKRAAEIESFQRHQRKIREELSYLRSNKLTLLKTGTYTPEDFLAEEANLNEKLEKLAILIQASDNSMHEVVKDIVTLSELTKDAYKYYFFGNSDEKEKIISLIFSELKISGNTLEFKGKNGFQVLEKHSIVLGGPKTWISELIPFQALIKDSIFDLKKAIS